MDNQAKRSAMVVAVTTMASLLGEMDQDYHQVCSDLVDQTHKSEDLERKLSASHMLSDSLQRELDSLRAKKAPAAPSPDEYRIRALLLLLDTVLSTEVDKLAAAKRFMLNVVNRDAGTDLEFFSNKIACIKRVREITGWGLMDSKVFYEHLMANAGHLLTNILQGG